MMDPNSTTGLVFWVNGTTCDQVTVTQNQGRLGSTSQYVGGGCQIKLNAAGLASKGTVSVGVKPADGVTSSRGLSFSLNVELLAPGSLTPRQIQMAAQTEADLTTVISELVQKCPSDSQPLDCRLAVAMGQRRLGDLDSAQMTYREVVDAAVVAGHPSEAFEAAIRLTSVLGDSGLTTDAQDEFVRAQTLASPGYGRDRIWWAYYRAVFLRSVNRLEEASGWFSSALADANRMGFRDVIRKTTIPFAYTLLNLGQTQGAVQLLRADSFGQLIDGADDCTQAAQRAYRGWILDLVMDATGSLTPVPWQSAQETLTGIFVQALAYREKCVDSSYKANLLTGLAFAAYLENQTSEAQNWLNQARTLPGATPTEQMDQIDLQGRVTLKAGDPGGALVQFQQLDNVSHSKYPTVEYQCRAAMGQAEALKALGQIGSGGASLQILQQCLKKTSSDLPPIVLQALMHRVSSLGITF